MKTKLKSMSKRTLSIILVLLMVVSTVTVGIITTTAAYVDKDDNTVGAKADTETVGAVVGEESVGATAPTIYMDGGISQMYTLGQDVTIDMAGKTFEGNDRLVLYIKDNEDKQYFNGDNVNLGDSVTGDVKNDGSVKLIHAAQYTSVTLNISKNNDKLTLNWKSGVPATSDYYVLGIDNWTASASNKMSQSGTTYTKTFENCAAGNYTFKIKNGSNWYNSYETNCASGNAYTSGTLGWKGNDNNIGFSTNQKSHITITFDSNSKKVTSIVANIARKSVASSVGLTVSPKNVKHGNRIRSITATATGIDAAIQNVTYTFKTNDTVIATVDHYLGTSHGGTDSCVLSGIETGDGAANFPSGETNVFTNTANDIPVEVTLSTSEQYDDNGTLTNYLDKTASTTFTIDDGSVYYTHAGADEENPDWTALNKTTVNEITDNVSTLTYDGDGFTFALSGQDEFEATFGKYEIDQEKNAYCSVTEGRKTIGTGTDSFTVYTYTVKPLKGIKAGTTKLYIDVANKKIYAKAKFEKTTGYTKTENESKTIKYYFAKKADQDFDKRGSNSGKLWLHAWNNSTGKNGYFSGNPVKKDGTTEDPADTAPSGTKIYVKTNDLKFDAKLNQSGGDPSSPNYSYSTDAEKAEADTFNVFVVELPVWATSVAVNKPGGGGDIESAKLITINPNRIYLFYDWDGVKVSGIPLDKKFWNNDVASRGTYPNEASEKTFKANAVSFNRNTYSTSNIDDNNYNINQYLSGKYNGTSSTGIYFGNFWNGYPTMDDGSASEHIYKYGSTAKKGIADKTWKNWNWTANIAMRWDNVRTGSDVNKIDADDNKLAPDAGCPYYTSIWDIVGMHLNRNKTNAIGNYYLQNFAEDQNAPFFDYDTLKTQSNAATHVFENKDFPFVSSTYEGITTYSYDSQVDPNRAITNDHNGDAAQENFTNTHGVKKVSSMLGYVPFANYDQELSFANEFDIDFYLTNTGSIKGKRDDGTAVQEDIQFNFSGDDDVWVFVDGVLVLDLGGDHMPSAGSINFTKKKVYYKSTVGSVNSESAVVLSRNYAGDTDKDDFSTDADYMKTLDLEMILNAGSLTGEKFNFTDGTTKHTLQMFYLERGQNESNCSLSFNMPQSTGLNIETKVTADHVNPGLVEKAMLAANKDAFRYNVSAKIANDTEFGNLRTAYPSLLASRTYNSSSLSSLDTTPEYPSLFDAWRQFTQGTTSVKGKLSSNTSSNPQPATALTSLSDSEYTVLSDKTYELSDKYIKDPASDDAIAGHTLTNATGSYAAGDFNLLTGQKATFNNQIPSNTLIQLYQNKDLDEAKYTGDDNLITYSPVAHNEVYDYYSTSYEIYDNQYMYYVKDKTDATSIKSVYAKDNSTNTDPSFFFTNYTSDAGVINPAMTVTYYNDINVGDITIKKELNVGGTTENEFDFKVYFKDVFGYDVDGASSDYAEAPHLTYHRYYIPAAGETPQPVFDGDPELPYNENRGISLRAGEMAVIKGVPVETKFKVVEAQTMGYDLSTIVKRAFKPDGTNVTYISHDDYDAAYNNEQIFYERIDNNTKTIMCPDVGEMSSYSYPTISYSTLIDGHDSIDIPNGNGTETDKYYYNMIPIRSLTNVSDQYVSNSEITFTNKRDGIDVTFNYYPRLVITGKPASISNIPDSYTFSIQDLYAKDKDNKYKYVKLTDGTVSDVNFEAMMKDAIKDFLTCNGGVFENVIDDYKYFYSQKAYQEYFFDGDTQKVINPSVKAGRTEYTKENTVYHMDYISQPLTGSPTYKDKWVSYFKDKDMTKYCDVEAAGAVLSDKTAIKKINVWLYNTPRKYHVHYNTVGATADATAFDELENGYYVANTPSSDDFTFYYNQRFGGKALDDVNDEEQLDFLGPNEYGYSSYTGQMLNTAETVSIDGTEYKFLYWSFDQKGLSKASDQIGYYYRVATDFTMYPVYGTEAQYEEFKNKPGLSVSINGEDSYFDKTGAPKRRVNVLLTPYNCPDNDPNIYSSSIIYITLSDEAKRYCLNGGTSVDPAKVHELYSKFKDNLSDLIKADQSKFTGVVNPYSYELGVTGFRHDIEGKGPISPALLTSKNRAQFATKFSISGEAGYANKVLLAAATMLYRSTDDEGAEHFNWIVSDNAVSYDFSPISRN